MKIDTFHKSTANELFAIKDRVRNLVNHWGEDGKYKEAILKTVIQRFLPERLKIGSGFVVKQTTNENEHEATSQIDLIIYDTSYPTLFKEGDFVIVTPDAVCGIIEVKTNLEKRDPKKVIEKCNKLGAFIFLAKRRKIDLFFNGVFSYEGFEKTKYSTFERMIKTAGSKYEAEEHSIKFLVNNISFNKDKYFRLWTEETSTISKDDPNGYIYLTQDLSFSFFISSLIDFVGVNSVIDNSSLWYPHGDGIHVKRKFFLSKVT